MGKQYKIIVDTNIFISFLIGRKLVGLKQLLVEDKVCLIYTDQLLLEINIVTSRPNLSKYFKPQDVLNLISLIKQIGLYYKVDTVPDICRDKKDNFLLGLAQISNADYLITGDADLLVLSNYNRTKIIKYQKFEAILNIV